MAQHHQQTSLVAKIKKFFFSRENLGIIDDTFVDSFGSLKQYLISKKILGVFCGNLVDEVHCVIPHAVVSQVD